MLSTTIWHFPSLFLKNLLLVKSNLTLTFLGKCIFEARFHGKSKIIYLQIFSSGQWCFVAHFPKSEKSVVHFYVNISPQFWSNVDGNYLWNCAPSGSKSQSENRDMGNHPIWSSNQLFYFNCILNITVINPSRKKGLWIWWMSNWGDPSCPKRQMMKNLEYDKIYVLAFL